jgi:hypothetical protein
MGTDIVRATSHGVRVGLLNPDLLNGEFNRRLIATTQARAMEADHAFTRGLQPAIGQAVVVMTLADVSAWDRAEERMGEAVVQIMQAQERAEARLGASQEQLASVVMAAARTEEAASGTKSMEATREGALMTAGVPIARR